MAPVVVLAAALTAGRAHAQDGSTLYAARCATCHEGGAATRAPGRAILGRMSADAILRAMDAGVMSQQAAGLPLAERRAIAAYLGTPAPLAAADAPQAAAAAATPPATASGCATAAAFQPTAGPRWSGWGATLDNHRFADGATAGLSAPDVPRLQLKWAYGFAGDVAAYGQPAVAGGRVFVGSQGGRVHAVDLESGCTHWVFQADAGVRTAPSVGPVDDAAGRYAVYFGDLRAHVYAVNAATGALLWKVRLDTHPAARITGAPVLHDGRLFVPVSSLEEYTAMTPAYECCRFRGSLVALDARTGQQRWQTYTVDEPVARGTTSAGATRWGPSGVAIWSAPTLDAERGVLYVATGDSYTEPAAATSDAVLAVAAADGRVLWVKQVTEGDAYNMACNGNGPNCPDADGPDFDFGASPMLVSLGDDRRALVVGQKSGIVWALDPDRQGAVLWQARVGTGGLLGGVEWGTATDGTLAYAAVSDVGLRLAAGERRRTEMDPGRGGGLVGLRVADGTRAWSAPPPVCGDRRPCSPAQSAAVTAIAGVVFSGALDGVMRAYSTTDGAVVWSVDTVRPFETVNGVKAMGGSIDSAGPVVVDGTLLFTSGYGSWGGAPGNVLLAFSVDAR